MTASTLLSIHRLEHGCGHWAAFRVARRKLSVVDFKIQSFSDLYPGVIHSLVKALLFLIRLVQEAVVPILTQVLCLKSSLGSREIVARHIGRQMGAATAHVVAGVLNVGVVLSDVIGVSE